jgi:L-amino acid N-acyltransferase YncA
MVREMQNKDSPDVLRIYGLGLKSGNSTFETTVPTWEDWDSRHISHSRYVFEDKGIVSGWIALSPFSTRPVYSGVAEVSVYVDPGFHGKKIGSALMEQLIVSSELHGIWTLFSSVFPENEATLKLHQKFGFRVIGKRERIAMLNGKWRDTILLEKRSSIL